MGRNATLAIATGMILGILVGGLCHGLFDPAKASAIGGAFSLITEIFLRLIGMIIAPLVFSTLVSGIANMGMGEVGRIGIKILIGFFAASVLSLSIGILMAVLVHPGGALHFPIPPANATSAVTADLSVRSFLEHVFPSSVINAMAENQVLQIVVFSVFAGLALSALGPRAANLRSLIEQVALMMLKVTDYVMKLAPFAAFAALAGTIAIHGLGIIDTYASFVGTFYCGLFILWCVLILAAFLVMGRQIVSLLLVLRQPAMVAFSTASSEAAYPRTLESLEKFGVSNRIASFVLPLGYSFNLTGSMMYAAFAIIFVAQAYGVPLTLQQYVAMGAMLFVTSKGIASVPRAALVVVSATLPLFHIPEAGLLLVLGVDQLMDMGRTATNVVGNGIAAAVIAKMEGELESVSLAKAVAA
jgi:Na+/H+-dicarboxylate symporter